MRSGTFWHSEWHLFIHLQKLGTLGNQCETYFFDSLFKNILTLNMQVRIILTLDETNIMPYRSMVGSLGQKAYFQFAVSFRECSHNLHPGTATPVALWATECMVSLLALWCRNDMTHSLGPTPTTGGGKGWMGWAGITQLNPRQKWRWMVDKFSGLLNMVFCFRYCFHAFQLPPSLQGKNQH